MNSKIELSIRLLEEIRNDSNNKDEVGEIDSLIAAIKDFAGGVDKEELNRESVPMIIDTINFCLPYLERNYELANRTEQTLPMGKLKKMLVKEFQENDELYGMNINRWMDENKFIVAKRGGKKSGLNNCKNI